MKECRSDCPLNISLENLGDKWTLLIIRDIMFLNKRHFNELLNNEEGIASNVLTSRLQNLEKIGVLLKTKDPNHKQKNVYTLTNIGIGLLPLMFEMTQWSIKYQISDDNPMKDHIINQYNEHSKMRGDIESKLEEEYEKIKQENNL